ncbi:MAG: hypothetical protein A3G59_01455 [Candidatus Taylorbacteria bacterium RIFCSPLOWO2_12_FULL_47_20]|uniref:HTH deoR-type domain-containing protein n=2 Tax=Candidatus Tayloriibacteriota TaxID=1817919 RepID=A0A1G2P6Q0_9BACT|nr:MAG: hypothetical protein A3H68_02645 [Candidatus Taylorbacteria bacterium RIFCSPLOWO2_02_FULL_46_40]OHA43399.1 MAG: hypothetical protein A3G59_01455 [Candidatus Taylorbacteria bacterium RIFCSPLOWO2_12_FULL_47_20]
MNNSNLSNYNRISKEEANTLKQSFGGDFESVYLFKRTQSIVSAIYLITGIMTDTEPIKGTLRSIGARALVSVSEVLSVVESGNTPLTRVNKDFLSLSSLLSVASKSGMISQMNASLVNSEIFKLSGEFLKFGDKTGPQSSILEEIRNGKGFEYFAGFGSKSARRGIGKGRIRVSAGDNSNRVLVNTRSDHGVSDTKNVVAVPDHVVSDRVPRAVDRTVDREVELSDRKLLIMDILSDGERKTVGDLSRYIINTSDKTIQRDLVALVGNGILRREGKKRWTKYYLAEVVNGQDEKNTLYS